MIKMSLHVKLFYDFLQDQVVEWDLGPVAQNL